jgi:hypothetical protein
MTLFKSGSVERMAGDAHLGTTESVIMSTGSHLPSSIEGIKRLAKSIKRERGIPHMQALDAAAQSAGYHNLQHAKNALAAAADAHSHLIYVTSYWRDPKSNHEGRETMTWRLSRPLRALVPNGLYGYRLDASDHLEERDDRANAENARENVLRTIRHLQFAAAACVRPWGGASIRDFEWTQDIPHKDHMTFWQHLETGAFLFADEPYCDPHDRLKERQAWARDGGGNGVAMAAPEWAGMYLPTQSALLLAVRKEDELVLGRIVDALKGAQAPAVDWRGESAPYYPTFASPARRASGRAKQSRPRRLPSGTVRKGARVVGSLPGRRWWRPNATMPLPNHIEAATVLDAATAWSGHARNEVYRKHIRAIRNDLDLWFGEEFRGRGADAELYFGSRGGADRLGLEQPPDLRSLRALILTHYPACSPRERLLKHVDAAAVYVTRRMVTTAVVPAASAGDLRVR